MGDDPNKPTGSPCRLGANADVATADAIPADATTSDAVTAGSDFNGFRFGRAKRAARSAAELPGPSRKPLRSAMRSRFRPAF
jgi:hypothetical protein